MYSQKNFEQNHWLTHIRETTNLKKSGRLNAYDSQGTSVALEWEILDGQTPRLTQKIKSLSDLLTKAYTPIEVDFAREFPEEIPHEMFLKNLTPLFEQGVNKVDWNVVQKKVEMTLHDFFSTTDFAPFAGPDDVHVFVEIKDTANVTRGVIQFLITPLFDFGTLRVCFYGISPEEQSRGLEQLLMSSIFRLIPDTKNLFLHTRKTNKAALALYRSWGFTEGHSKLPQWVDLEYVIDRSMSLQDKAQSFFNH